LSRHVEIKDSDIANKFIFSKSIINSDLLRYGDVKELLDYINNNNVELKEVKFLISKANVKLRMNDKKLFIRKSTDKDFANRICMTTR
jgi:hypothetical protein